jgi:hypothetical protein
MNYCAHKNQPLDSIPSQFIPVHAMFTNIHLNIIVPLAPRPPKQCFLSNMKTEDLKAAASTNSNAGFWYVMACSPLKVHRRFGGNYYFYLQGRRVSRVSK